MRREYGDPPDPKPTPPPRELPDGGADGDD
jgi:hypothetical protein